MLSYINMCRLCSGISQVRWESETSFYSVLSHQYFCQKLWKSVNVRRSYSVPHQIIWHTVWNQKHVGFVIINAYQIRGDVLQFLPHDAMHARYQPWACVCLCLCLSVTSRSSTKTAKRRLTQTTPQDSSGILVIWCQKYPRNSTGVTPYDGTKCRLGGSKSATFDKYPAILYLENGTRQTHSFY